MAIFHQHLSNGGKNCSFARWVEGYGRFQEDLLQASYGEICIERGHLDPMTLQVMMEVEGKIIVGEG